jgi:hypothetical protein
MKRVVVSMMVKIMIVIIIKVTNKTIWSIECSYDFDTTSENKILYLCIVESPVCLIANYSIH